jgi:alkaline phosphatase
MISDGFGPASETFARNIYQHEPLDTMLVGTCRTRPADLNQKEKTPKAQKSGSPITDSAAGATAFSCGIKTYNAGVAGNLKYIENIF